MFILRDNPHIVRLSHPNAHRRHPTQQTRYHQDQPGQNYILSIKINYHPRYFVYCKRESPDDKNHLVPQTIYHNRRERTEKSIREIHNPKRNRTEILISKVHVYLRDYCFERRVSGKGRHKSQTNENH